MPEAGVPQRRAGLGRFRPYPEYKDSGIDWLGQIPAHWAVVRLKRILSEPLQYGANGSTQHVEVQPLCTDIAS
jgi:hypothetical protein